MNKIKLFILPILATSFISVSSVYATANLKSNTTNVHVGESFTISLKIDIVAAWNIHINAFGPVEGCTLTEADVTEDAKDTTKEFSTICKATEQGIIIINLSGDYTTEDRNNISLSDELNINVSEASTTSNDTAITTTTDNNQNSNTPNTGQNTNTRNMESNAFYWSIITAIPALLLIVFYMIIHKKHKYTPKDN